MKRALVVLLFALLSVVRARAQDAEAPALQLALSFDASVSEPERAAMRAAIAAELHATLIDSPAPGVGALHVARSADGALVLTLHEQPPPIARSVPPSQDLAATARDVALMAKNLVLDQTEALLAQQATPPTPVPPAPATPARPPQARDDEQPPGFQPRLPVRPPPPLPEPGAQVYLFGLIAPPIAVSARAAGESHSPSTAGYGMHARFELPIGAGLFAGGSVQLALWEAREEDEVGGSLGLSSNAVMDASAHAGARFSLSRSAALHALLGAGPSTYSVFHVAMGSYDDRYSAAPYLGANGMLLVGASLQLFRGFGVALELGPHYHFMHGRDAVANTRVVVHALQLGVQLGAKWAFDAQ